MVADLGTPAHELESSSLVPTEPFVGIRARRPAQLRQLGVERRRATPAPHHTNNKPVGKISCVKVGDDTSANWYNSDTDVVGS